MRPHTGKTTSAWLADVSMPSFPPLTADAHADVCVVGAGIAGLTTAHLLAKEGQSVLVLDAGPVAAGQTQRTTAHLSNAIDDRYFEIERLHGEDGARLAAASHTRAIAEIERISRAEGIDCDFTRLDGYLFVPPGESADVLEEEIKAAHRTGLTDVAWAERAPMPYDTGRCLRWPRQGQFHPLKYLAGLVRCVQRDGGRIHTDTHVRSVEGGPPGQVVTSRGPTVTADAVVVATNSPINDRYAIHTKQAAYITYVVALAVKPGSVTKALFWDTLDPYHYVRTQPEPGGRELLIVGGEDHKTGQADDQAERFGRLEAWARERFPMAAGVEFRWSGQVMETVDGLAFIGRNPGDERVFIATGDSGMGMTHGTIAGLLISDLVLGHDNPWAGLYDPSRKRVKAGWEFTKENLNVAAQYGAYLTGGDVSSVDEIGPGSGAVVRRGLSKVAVYRDEGGTLHECSAVCPHLGGIVAWNDVEKTWDCPVHGSRFSACGDVLQGPANRGLAKVEEPAEAKSRK
jgi:glycine/D-amino acid oxidase-like deaminating enzyme/nitrite reductase/ring-hydroxylating ferredoxin subunit